MKKFKLLCALTIILGCLNGCTLNKSTLNTKTNEITRNTAAEKEHLSEKQNDNLNTTAINNTEEINTENFVSDVGLIEYENKLFNFKLGIPGTWSFKDNYNGFDLILYTPKNDKINENLGIKIQELQVEQNIESYLETTIIELKKLYTDLNQQQIKNTDTNKGKSIIYEFSNEGIDLKAQQTVLIQDNKAYVFTYTAAKDTFDKYIDTINKIINSFTILN